MCMSNRGFKVLLSIIIGPYLPFLVGFSQEDVRRLFPFFQKNVWEMLKESGYLHIQATKPDTAGENVQKYLAKYYKDRLKLLESAACCLNSFSHYLLLQLYACAGRGLNDSPVALAAYILEKFSTWTHMKNRDLEDGGLER